MSQGKPHPSTFVRGSERVANHGGYALPRMVLSRSSSGFDNLVLLKTANSGFEGFMRDSLTTLPETADRLFGTAMRAAMEISIRAGLPFDQLRTQAAGDLDRCLCPARQQVGATHALCHGPGSARSRTGDRWTVELAMPNKHCLLVDLSRFGQTNPNQIFVPTDEPYGNIVARICQKLK